MRKLALIIGLVGMAFGAVGFGTMTPVFNTTYGVKKGSNLDNAKCGVCHVGAKGGKLNPYGEDLAAAMKAANTKKLTKEILVSVEGKDSNKNGKKNIEDIKADVNPGLK